MDNKKTMRPLDFLHDSSIFKYKEGTDKEGNDCMTCIDNRIALCRLLMFDMQLVCSRLIDSFDKEETMGVSFSIGIASMGPEKFIDMENFIKKADKAMYEAKAASKENPGHHVRCAGRLEKARNERA